MDIGSLLPKVGESGRYRESPTKGGRVVDIGSLIPKVGECGRYRESPAKGGRVW